MKHTIRNASPTGYSPRSKARFAGLIILLVLLCSTLTGCQELQNAKPITDVHALDGQRVGVGIGWGPDYLLTGRDDLNLMRFNSISDAVTALCYHRVDAVAVEYPLSINIMNSISGLRRIEEPISEDYIGFLVAIDQTELLQELNDFIAEFVTTPEFEDLVSRSREPNGYQYKPVPLIGGDRALQVGLVDNGYPFTYINTQTGAMEGSDVEILCHFANSRGYDLDLHGASWESMSMGVAYGEYEIGAGGISEQYRSDTELSQSGLLTDTFFPVDVVFVEVEDRDAVAVKQTLDY